MTDKSSEKHGSTTGKRETSRYTDKVSGRPGKKSGTNPPAPVDRRPDPPPAPPKTNKE